MILKHKGLSFEDDKIEVFFGNKHFSLNELTQLKPTGVHAVKQTHSDIFHIVDREEPYHPQLEGDALGTQLGKQHLIIKTADCLPVMIYAPEIGRVSAIHAGWKGVALRIVPKAIETYFKNAIHLKIYIGPHITKDSFEIKQDVLTQLQVSVPSSNRNKISVETRAEKFHVDLVQITTLQILSDFPDIKLDVMDSNVDTKTNLDFNSYRRDQIHSGRNISYIKLK